MKIFYIVPICLALLFSSANISAQCCGNYRYESEDYGYEGDDYRYQCIDNLCNSGFNFIDFAGDVSLLASYSMGDSLGICGNYGSVGLFYARCLQPCSFGPVAEASYLYFGNGGFGVDAAFGVRINNMDDSMVGGAHLFYGYREGSIGDFHQMGVKFEVIGNCFEFVANGYFPLEGDDKTKVEQIFDDYDNSSTETPYRVYVLRNEYALKGFDAEGGFRCCWNGVSAYAGVGTYYFQNKCYFDEWGAKGRLRFEYGSYLAVEGQITYDDYNEMDGRIGVEFNFPFEAICDLCKGAVCPCNSQRRTFRERPIHLLKGCRYETNY